MIFGPFQTLIQRLTGRSRPVRTVVVYSRDGCTCCDKAMTELEKYKRKYNLDIRTVDVDTDAELAEKFGLEVPVVEIDGKVRFRGKVNAILLQRIFAGVNQDH